METSRDTATLLTQPLTVNLISLIKLAVFLSFPYRWDFIQKSVPMYLIK